MGRQDFEGAPISGVTGDVAGSTVSDVGSSQSLGQMASGETFSGADIYGGGETEQQIRQNISNVRQQFQNLPEQSKDLNFGQFSDLASRAGMYDINGFSLDDIFNPFNFGLLGPILGGISNLASRGLMGGLEKGYLPQYNKLGQVVATFNPKTGQYGQGSVLGSIDPNDPRNEPISTSSDDGQPFDSNTVAVGPREKTIEEEEEERSMIREGLIRPEGGYFPTTGRFLRLGLLDQPIDTYGGLLAGQDPAAFGAMNMAFRRPTNVEYFQDPYDMTGYTLI